MSILRSRTQTPTCRAYAQAVDARSHAVLARLVLLASALFMPLSAVHAQSSERVTLNGRNVALYNLVGHLRVTGGGTSAVATI
ncbi:MAG: hypothetical protein ABI852_11075, partial [Gemmatimonadaceae bacterium]